MRKEGVLIIGLACCILLVLGVTALKFHPLPVNAPLEKLTQPPIRDTDPTSGPDNAPVTMIIYSDFACESCAGLATEMTQMMQEPAFVGKIRLVWKDFPVHENSIPASFDLHEAALCAATAGKFWQFSNAIFAHGNELRIGTDILPLVLQETGLPLSRVQPCIKSTAIDDLIRQNMADGRALGITGTPTYFINGTRMVGLVSYPMLQGVIKNILAQTQYETASK